MLAAIGRALTMSFAMTWEILWVIDSRPLP